MGERHFRLIVGSVLLAALYFDNVAAMIGLIAVLTVEGLTNWRVPILVTRLRYGIPEPITQVSETVDACAVVRDDKPGLEFEAERALRLLIATALALSYFVFPRQIWLLPWFLAFAMLAGGLSGICFMVLGLKKLGFA